MYQFFLFIQCISILILLGETIYVFINWKTKGQSFLMLYCAAALINNVGYLMSMNAQTAREALFAAKFSYLGKVWIPISFLAMVLEMCEIRVSKTAHAAFACLHAGVLLLVLTCDRHNLYYSAKRDFVYTGLFPHNEYGHTIIYNAYTALIFVYIVAGLVILIRHYIKDNDEDTRHLYRHLILAIAVMAGGLIAYMLKITDGYDSTNLGYALASIILLITMFSFDFLDSLSIIKDYAIDSIPEGVIATDTEGRVTYYNKAAKEIYKDLDIAPFTIINSIKKTIEDESVVTIRDKIYEPSCKPFHRGKLERGMLFMLNDVTVRYKHMEELQIQKDIAESANASKSAFLSVVTHEIRTPMTSIVGMTELILRDEEALNKKQVKYLRNIKNSGDALVTIVNDILDQSKIESGKMEILEEPYELLPVVNDVMMIIDNRIGSKKVHLMYEVDDDIPKYLIGDSLRIRQIMINLMNNAVKFTDEGYIKLEIKCVEEEEKRRRLKFSVKDSGQGIMPEDLGKLGEAFTQVDSKKNHQKEGTGLGLSISKDFINLMGGKLEVKSEYGKGSEFFFSIWQGVATSLDVDVAPDGTMKPWQEEDEFTAPEAKVLVVDDIELNRLIVEELLLPLELSIDMAGSGEKAIELISENTYDAVFMDYMMPYMDGVTTTERIRAMALSDEFDNDKKEYFKSVPIIALSGDDSDATKEKFQLAGIDDFTTKPVEFKRLKKLLLKWLPSELVKRK